LLAIVVDWVTGSGEGRSATVVDCVTGSGSGEFTTGADCVVVSAGGGLFATTVLWVVGLGATACEVVVGVTVAGAGIDCGTALTVVGEATG